VRHLYTIICDDVRREDNFKLIIIGMYLGKITVPQLPAVLPTLTVLSVFEADRIENLHFTLQVQNLETGRPIVQAQGFTNVIQPGPVVIPVKFGPVRFDQAGTYNAITEMQGQQMLISEFQLILAPPINPVPTHRAM
jgi:hypothetical protein